MRPSRTAGSKGGVEESASHGRSDDTAHENGYHRDRAESEQRQPSSVSDAGEAGPGCRNTIELAQDPELACDRVAAVHHGGGQHAGDHGHDQDEDRARRHFPALDGVHNNAQRDDACGSRKAVNRSAQNPQPSLGFDDDVSRRPRVNLRGGESDGESGLGR